ncbi:small multi-drug export protein [Aureibacillus halotolerans]|uniref:Putative small multi-drug export protein n=1 Tax=Aureibacillus halotolerans TaxID=1508390 RepID=A0A4R6TVJ4_9BACI|nr:small multi-drug export protein [Aureibacillus halotolerans]TDQ37441.1 putative small multi-drug export protein [Aureibacillus halotolerans]
MAFFIAYLLVFVFAATPFFEVIAVIPIGALAGLNVIVVAVVALLGNLLTVLLVIFLAERLKKWNEDRRRRKGIDVDAPSKKRERAERLWTKYGIVGVSLLGPLIIGSHLAALTAMTFSNNKTKVTAWMTGSLVLWCVAMGVLSFYGVDLIQENTGNNGFLYEMLRVDE